MNVVIIDDTPFDLHHMVRLVDSIDGCESHGFLKTQDALKWCATEKPSLVVVDYLMPGADGFDLVRSLKSRPENAGVPVVLVTGFEEPRARRVAEKLGIDEVFTKPVDPARFVACARRLLGLGAPAAPAPDAPPRVLATVRKSQAPELQALEHEILTRLYQSLNLRDPESALRGSRVGHYSRIIAAGLGLARSDQQTLFRAAPLLDIGKLGVSESILQKEGSLSREEFESVKKHALDGYLLLRDSSMPALKCAAEIALTHHEKWDGSGYPRGLSENAIPLFGRIAAIADVFTAVTSPRPYGAPWSLEEGRELIRRGSGIQFDPVCVEAFLESWDQVVTIQGYFERVTPTTSAVASYAN
jgi:putative two-component system response regulator